MKNGFTDEDRKKIGEGVRQRYAKAARSPEGHFRFPTGAGEGIYLSATGDNYDASRILSPDLI
ncbi:MAG: methyltransferase domain-containing (seleno)protein, partial [Syntrophobacteraceae bacterium]